MQKIADKQGLKVVETIQESKSAKDSGGRIGYQNLLIGLQEQRFNAVLTWAPDRLSRNAGDLGKLVDLMDQQVLVQIQTSGQTFTNTPDEKFLLMILCSQAKLENDNRSKNVKRGLRTKCEMGVRPGRPPVGYKLVRAERFGDPSSIVVDEERVPYIKKLFTYIAEHSL
jgi:DNA invertase Pin-like site-specific DNA recombinase